MLKAISPIDGRYQSKTASLGNYFSEYALIRYRVWVEVEYFIALCEIPLPQLADVPENKLEKLRNFAEGFKLKSAERVKEIEATTNHDVKAVEYLIKEYFDEIGLEEYREFVHFGLTSQDINNTAFPLMLKDALEEVFFVQFDGMHEQLYLLAKEWVNVPMLARTHGQPASPTTVGKEIQVFVERLTVQMGQLAKISQKAKFGGATGNLNAHYVTYPEIDWIAFADAFIKNVLELERSHPTTQIEHYDNLAAVFHNLSRINTILIDLCRDIWTYISMDYFKQQTIAGEVGSSAMPHKVNPIDFENAEGNLGIANALFAHLAEKLPISRLQRDLTDSTVLRNIGVPIGHTLIALQSISKGLKKISLNEERLAKDLDANWAVVAEAIQNILRREGFDKPYEALKALTRGKGGITKEAIRAFIDNLEIGEKVKKELREITPQNYIGRGL